MARKKKENPILTKAVEEVNEVPAVKILVGAKKKKKIKIKGKPIVHVKRRNWDTDFYVDIINGKGFVISEPARITLDGVQKKSYNGAQSARYGTSFEDEQAFVERYSCDCGRFQSRKFEGEICPFCNTPVVEKGQDINITGYITLNGGNDSMINRIISPYYYNVLSSAIGKQVFPDIIYAKYKVTKNGTVLYPKEEDLDTEPSSPYYGIGMEAFYDNYEEIIEYFKGKKKNKASTFDKLLKEKRQVFCSHIPIESNILRPQSTTSDTFYYNTMDKIINTLFSLSESLKLCDEVDKIEKEYFLTRIQQKVNMMWEESFNTLNGKEGLIRDEILGGSLNYTSRNVICPDPSLRDSEVSLSYQTFLELFKYKIIFYIMKVEDVRLGKAYDIWKNAATFDQNVYDIMQFILKREKVKVLINRNPTLNFYSMLLMDIREVKPDDQDFSLSVPLSIN